MYSNNTQARSGALATSSANRAPDAPFLRFRLRYVVALVSKGNPLDFGGVLVQYHWKVFLPSKVHSTFFRDVMKWAYLKYIHFCLPKANT